MMEIIRPLLKPKRFEHSLNVAQQAVLLAKRHGEDEDKAYVAGILHDICKNMSQQEQLQWMQKSAIIWDDNLLKQPAGLAWICRGGIYQAGSGDRR